MSDEDELRVRLDKRIAAVELVAANEALPKSIRADANRTLQWLREYRQRPESRPELEDLRDTKVPAHLRDPALIRRLRESGAVVEDGYGAVTARWDLVAPGDRRAAFSYMNALVDAWQNRSVGGRPRK